MNLFLANNNLGSLRMSEGFVILENTYLRVNVMYYCKKYYT
jgi:hypothetical protein